MRGSFAITLLSATLLTGALIGGGVALGEDPKPSALPATVTAADPTMGAAQRAAGLSFGQPKYTWNYTDVKAGTATAEVVNERLEAADVQPVLTLRGPVTISDPGTKAEAALTVKIDGTVPGGGRGIISVGPTQGAPRLPSGTYTGRLAAFARDRRAVIHVPVTLSVAPDSTAGTVAPKPLASKVRIQAIRWLPFADSTVELRGARVPLSPSVPSTTQAAEITLKEGSVIGALPGDRSGIASVTYAGELEALSDDLLALKLDAANFDGPGTYEGTIHLLGEDEKSGDVVVTIVAKDSIIWAIIALGIGIVCAMWLRRWRGVERPLKLLQRRLEATKVSYAKATKRLTRKAGDEGWANYDTSEDFSEQASELSEDLAELENAPGVGGLIKTLFGLTATPFDKLPPERRDTIVAKLVKLEAHAADLGDLHTVSKALGAQLGKVRNLRPMEGLLPTGAGPTPAWLPNARSKLDGSKMTIDAFAKRIADMRVATEVAEWWRQAHVVVARDAKWIARARSAGVDTTTAHSLLQAAWTDLWFAPDAEAVADTRRRANLERGHWQVLLLLSALEGDAPPAVMRFATASLSTVSAIPRLDRAGAIAELAARSKARFDELGRHIRTGDAVATLLAWVVALFTGLVALYFTKSFGSPTDYLTAVLWGLTTASAIDTLIGALPRPAEPEVPAKPPAAA